MSTIAILPPEEALKVAAGEVVERPASIVKELIENAIDAKARTICLYIERSGKDLIRVVDDGHGMCPDDARLCILPHATSKIRSVNELSSIASFGFRGEALATISAVTNFTLVTKEQSNTTGTGTRITCENGAILTEEEVACPHGTDISVANLFYNTPARKKFLKQNETEFNHIQTQVHTFALANLSITFKLYRDGKLLLSAPATSSIISRMAQLWGHNLSEQFIPLQPIEQKQDDPALLSISGVISHHQFWRYNRNMIYFFVNNRLIKNQKLARALTKGYQNILPYGKFPAGVIFITIDGAFVDVNTHPRKEEVVFAKPLHVQHALERLIKNTLEGNVSSSVSGYKEEIEREMPQAPQPKKEALSFQPAKMIYHDAPEDAVPEDSAAEEGSFFHDEQTPLPSSFNPSDIARNSRKPTSAVPNEAESMTGLPQSQQPISFETKEAKSRQTRSIIGQFLKTYIIVENDEGLVIIDQHAAHERVLYEKFRKDFSSREGTRLLFPQVLKLSTHDFLAALEYQEFFAEHGVQLEEFGPNEIAIKTSPPKLEGTKLEELVFETLQFIAQNRTLERESFRRSLHEHMHSHKSCKLAVRAGDVLTIEEMNVLLDDLAKCENRYICAHGRPTMWTISQNELERKFKRKL